MKWFKGLFYPDYQTAYVISPINFSKLFLSFGRFNYKFANGWQSYFFIEGGVCIGKCRSFQCHWHVKGSERNINQFILTRKYGKSFSNN